MGKERSDSNEFLSLAALRQDYRFSKKWIERLGPPDKEKQNPVFRSATPMKLWRKDRVETFLKEHEGEYQNHLTRSEQRKKTGKAIAERKAQETIEYAQTVAVRLTVFPKELKKSLSGSPFNSGY